MTTKMTTKTKTKMQTQLNPGSSGRSARRAAGALTAAVALTAAWSAFADGSANSWYAEDEGAQPPLARAHAAYLEKDWSTMTESLRATLATPGLDPTATRNALALLGRAYEATDGNLPADWQPPAGVSDLKFTHGRKQEPDGLYYKIQFVANVVDRDTVTQVQVVRWPDTPVLDKAAGLGDYEIGQEEEGDWKFDLEAEQQTPLPDGLYLINFELKDGTRSGGWFVLSDLLASASPRVDSPAVAQTFSHGNPELRWEDFRSPEYKSYESRRFHMHVARKIAGAPGYEIPWAMYIEAPDATSAVVGVDPRGAGVSSLEDDRYWVTFQYLEQRKFGPLKLRRGAQTSRPMIIRR
jgi:hypothetical protein